MVLKNRSTQKGFTLIEVIVVITILAIVSTILIFLSGEQIMRSRLEVYANTVLASLYEHRSEIKNGLRFKKDLAFAPYCYGIAFTEQGMFSKITPYVSDMPSSPCLSSVLPEDPFSVSTQIALDDNFRFLSYRDNLGNEGSMPFYVFFAPPYGSMFLYKEESGTLVLLDFESIIVPMQYGTSGNLKKEILIEPQGGRISLLTSS